MNVRYSVLLSMLIWACATALPANAGALEDGTAAYQGKRYHAAEDLFNQAIASDPGNQKAYFWLGKTLEMLLDPKSARDAYINCYKINPFTQEGMSARKASLDLANRTAEEDAAPLDSAKQVQKTTSVINREAGELSQRWVDTGNKGYGWKMQQLNAMGQGYGPNAGYGNGNYGYRNPFGRGNTVSNMSYIQSSYLRSDYQVQAYRDRALGTQAGAYAQQSANNLEQLLAEKKKPGEAKLRALGTDLYNRYYGTKIDDGNAVSTPPPDPIEQLHATAKRLADLTPVPYSRQPVAQRAIARQLDLK